MALDPQLDLVLQFLEQQDRPPTEESSPQAARDGLRALTVGSLKPEDVVPVGGVETIEVAGRAARVYRPVHDAPHPTLVYFHGGGWVIGDLDTHDQACRRLCRGADTTVVAVDYRLAPEHPFPQGIEDAIAAVEWASEHLHELGGNDVLAVGGDSAGGNLATVTAQHWRGLVRAQLLIYPATDIGGEYPSRQENGDGLFLTTPIMEWFMAHYLSGGPVAVDDPRLSPLHGDLAGVAPALVVTAELDPLRDEGEAYAAALKDAGCAVELVRYDGMIHGFLDMAGFSTAASLHVDDVVRRFHDLVRR